MAKIKKPVSILLVFMMIVSLFAAVPMTVNAAPPSSDGYALTLYANNGTDQQYTTGKKRLDITKISDPSYYQFTTPAGKTFRCWNTAADGTGTDYASGSDYIHRYADLTLYAQWGYTVTWKDWDSTLLKTELLAEGTTPTYDGTTPTKAEDEKYTYTFAGWSPEITAVTGDVTYTAQYTATFKGITSDDLYEGLVLDEGTALKFMLMKSGERWKNGYLQVYLDDVLVKDLTVEGGPTTEPDRYYTTTKKCIVDSYEKYSNAHFIHFKSVYDVTWLNENGTVLEKDENIVVGTTPTYDGETPTKAEDENYTYTFAGWSPEITAVTGDITYTATFTATAKPKKLITGQSITLDGNIGINFYLDPAAAGLTVDQVTEDNLSYTFAWADGVNAKVEVAEQSGSTFVKDGDLIKVTCKVCAAEMTCDVNATFTLKGKTESKESKTYSVREYCNTVFKPTTEWLNAYKTKYPDGTAKCYDNLVGLVEAMLNYGAKAQTKFKVNTGKLANDGVTYNPGDVTDAKLDDAIAAANGTDKADNMNDVAAQHGAKWYSTSLIYLDNNTIRHYFVKDTDAFKPSDYPANKANYYYYVEKTGIPAAELDNLQTFTVGDDSFQYSALDFVKGMIHSSADGESQNLAKALYWYNQAANEYFPAPAPAENIVDLSTLEGDKELQNGDVVTGTLGGNYQITIADGATVTLRNANITNLGKNCNWAGISCPGNATLVLEGENTVCAGLDNYGNNNYPGIWIAPDKTLTIKGDGSLTAYSNNTEPYGAGIGGGFEIEAGNIVINGGTIIATGVVGAAGIGSGANASCGNITINGGTIIATGGEGAAGIGSGGYASCGTITINGGTVTAAGGEVAAGIGSGDSSSCGNITIADTVTQVTATKGSNAPNSIGAGKDGSCGTVTIAPGANVIQN